MDHSTQEFRSQESIQTHADFVADSDRSFAAFLQTLVRQAPDAGGCGGHPVGATGLSYEETAEICGVAIGTIKSRVNRARSRLAELLSIGGVDDLGPDHRITAAVQRAGPEIVNG